MSCIEMGGNFCLTQNQIESFGQSPVPYSSDFQGWDDIVFTHSGRSSITTAVHHLGLEKTVVLLPSFSCHSITDAFSSCDCRVRYYPINRDNLSVNLEGLFRLIDEDGPAIVYTCPLFGFDTLSSLRKHYKNIQGRGIVIMEDVTHSLLSGFNPPKADIVVCSLRKWLEIPDGGFVWGLKDFDIERFYVEHQEETPVVNNFVNASKLKLDYFKTGNEELKNEFLPLFYKNNDLFNDCSKVCRMSSFSHEILLQADFEKMIQRRRANYEYLLAHINNPLVEIIFDELPHDVVPLYMQINVRNEQRTPLQRALVKERLYCPVIWPTPEQIISACSKQEIHFHEEMLSLVIDQRYDIDDMERLVWNINNFTF